MALRADAGIPIAAGQGVAAGAVPVRRPRLRRQPARPARHCRGNRADAQRFSRPRRHRGRQRDAPWPTNIGDDVRSAAALNAGDGLAIVASQVLRRATRRLDRDLADLVWAEFDTMAMRTLEGQATEIGWQLDEVEDLNPEDYLHLIMHKTCWYTTIHPLRVGAIVGSRGKVELGPLVRFGFHFGAAFQIRDDLLNLVGDERMYGKEILAALYEGKRTLPLMHLLSVAQGTDHALVREYLHLKRSQRSAELVSRVRALMDDYGSIAFTSEYAEASCQSPKSTSNTPSPVPNPVPT